MGYTVAWDTAPAADGDILATLGEVVPYQWYEIELADDFAQNLGGKPLSIRIAPSHGLRCAYSSSEDRLGHLPQLLIKADMFKEGITLIVLQIQGLSCLVNHSV